MHNTSEDNEGTSDTYTDYNISIPKQNRKENIAIIPKLGNEL